VPPIIGFASIGYKDTVRNIEQTGEFVWNLVTRPLVEPMNQSCAAVPPEVNEFELAGLSARLARAPAARGREPGPFRMPAEPADPAAKRRGRAAADLAGAGRGGGGAHRRSLLRDGVFDTRRPAPCCGGGPADYFSIGPEQLFKLYRPR
jgi:hypothetical protein